MGGFSFCSVEEVIPLTAICAHQKRFLGGRQLYETGFFHVKRDKIVVRTRKKRRDRLYDNTMRSFQGND